jgi:hypothetical protein
MYLCNSTEPGDPYIPREDEGLVIETCPGRVSESVEWTHMQMLCLIIYLFC